MASYQHTRPYGNTHIGGNASVQLGDQYIERLNDFHIETAYVIVQTELEVLQDRDGRKLKRCLQNSFGQQYEHGRLAQKFRKPNALYQQPELANINTHRQPNSLKRKRVPTETKFSTQNCGNSFKNQCKRRRRGQDDGSDASDESSDSRQVPKPHDNGARSGFNVDQVLRDVRMKSSYSSSLCSRKSFRPQHLSAVYRTIRLAYTNPFVTSIIISSTQFNDSEYLPEPIVLYDLRDLSLIAANTPPPLHRLASMCAFMISCLIYKATLSKGFEKLLAKCQRDNTLSLMAWLYSAGMKHCVRYSSMFRGTLLGDCLVLEDAFGQERSVSMLICEHPVLVKRFLQSHYADSPGEDFVSRGQYNLLLKSRYGLSIRDTHWSMKNVIKANTRVVMAVFMQVKNPQCLECMSRLRISNWKEFSCTNCRRKFRRCRHPPALKHMSLEDSHTSSWRDTQGVYLPLIPRSATFEPQECEPEINNASRTAMDISCFKNIDLEVVSCQNFYPPIIPRQHKDSYGEQKIHGSEKLLSSTSQSLVIEPTYRKTVAALLEAYEDGSMISVPIGSTEASLCNPGQQISCTSTARLARANNSNKDATLSLEFIERTIHNVMGSLNGHDIIGRA